MRRIKSLRKRIAGRVKTEIGAALKVIAEIASVSAGTREKRVRFTRDFKTLVKSVGMPMIDIERFQHKSGGVRELAIGEFISSWAVKFNRRPEVRIKAFFIGLNKLLERIDLSIGILKVFFLEELDGLLRVMSPDEIWAIVMSAKPLPVEPTGAEEIAARAAKTAMMAEKKGTVRLSPSKLSIEVSPILADTHCVVEKTRETVDQARAIAAQIRQKAAHG